MSTRPHVKESTVSIEVLRECFTADFETGKLAWKLRPLSHFASTSSRASFLTGNYHKPPGGISGCGHVVVRISIKGKTATIYAHRIVWALYHGAWPNGLIDHRNSIKTDNRIDNLRIATPAQNSINRGIGPRSSSGVKGVHQMKSNGRFQAHIRYQGKRIHLGFFSSLEEAAASRSAAEREYFGEFAYSASQAVQSIPLGGLES